MSYTVKSTPCDSNDYQLSFYSDLTGDDEFSIDILPCSNTTTSGSESSSSNGGEGGNSGGSSEVVSGVNNEDGSIMSSGGGGESDAVATVATTSSTEASSTTTSTTSRTTITSAATTTTTFTAVEPEEAQTDEGSTETQESPNNLTDNSNEEDSDETPEEAPTETPNEHTAETTEIETTKVTESTFYTCHPNPTSLLSGEFAPDDVAANKFEIAYDYELTTPMDTGGGEGNALEELENVMANDLAAQFGLIDCMARRGLRNKKMRNSGGNDAVVAIGSDPVDQVMEGESCTSPTEPNTVCTPVRGYMTVWSESTSVSDISADIHDRIQSGMNNGSYESDTVAKVLYIGVPSEPDQQADVDQANSITTQSQEMTDTDTPGNSVFLPVGISIFALAMASIALFILHRRRKAHAERNGPKPTDTLLHQQELHAQTIDLEDDINLLPSPDKLDMRPIHDTDSDTESGDNRNGSGDAMEDDTSANSAKTPTAKYAIHAAQTPMNVQCCLLKNLTQDDDMQSIQESIMSEEESVESGSATSGKSTSLAAMGAASTLTMRMAGSENGI